MSAGPIVRVTVGVPDPPTAAGRYLAAFGWTVRPDGERDRITVGPPGGQGGDVRLVRTEGSPPAPFTTYGWAALELAVRDVDQAVLDAERAGFTVLVPPLRLGTLPLRAAQLAGTGGEGVYLTQILGEVPGFALPRQRDPVDGVFIAVLATPDLEESRRVVESRLGAVRASDRRARIQVLNHAFGLPDTTEHRLSSVRLAERAAIEIDEYPGTARPRAAPRSGPVPGMGVVTVRGAEPAAFALPYGGLVEVEPTTHIYRTPVSHKETIRPHPLT
ncbi:VOC family protein [Streptosporangium sp. NPDC001681]|uniref:VOC family protein n=1 Tax=Streptosporangium sp. NPDC001681 TaxID=3154395 RepID=UPI00332CBC67